jgi:hypothetical protein
MLPTLISMALAADGAIPVWGTLSGGDGAPLTGTHAVTLEVVDGSGGVLWDADVEVHFDEGAFAAQLGPLDLDLFATEAARFLRVTTGGVSSAPVPVGFAPRAGWAANAGALGGQPPSAYRRATDLIPWSQLADVPAGFDDGTDDGNTYAAGAGLSLTGNTFSVTNAYTFGAGLRLNAGTIELAPRLVTTPTKLHFPLSAPDASFTLTNLGGAAVAGLGFAASSGFSTNHDCGAALAGGASCNVGVTYTGGVTSGTVTVTGTGVSASTVALTAALGGAGSDGSVTVSSSLNLQTASLGASLDRNGAAADGVAFRLAAAPSSNLLTMTEAIGAGIVPGDQVLLINLQGTSSDNADVGNWELLDVTGVSGSTLTLATAPTRTYVGTTFSNQKIYVQRVPQYSAVTVASGGAITGAAFNAASTAPIRTGIVAFEVSGTLTVAAGGAIHANNLGFPGGISTAQFGVVNQGASPLGPGVVSQSANGGGGGGGHHQSGAHSGGGGGASYGTAGENGFYDNVGAMGAAGAVYGTASLSKIYLGSGGGGGSENTTTTGGRGGLGGGAVMLWAGTIAVGGGISANGEQGFGPNAGSQDSGGSGSGGSVLLRASAVTLGSNLVTAVGGARSVGVTGGGSSAGGAGGAGRIAVQYQTITGATNPAATTSAF